MLIPTKYGSKNKLIPRDSGWTSPEYEPGDANWELQGFRLDSHVVIDCDTLAAGPVWAAISSVDTYIVRTPHGLHFYYEGTIDQKEIRKFPGIDLLGTRKAYVNCPPSPGYTVLVDNPIAPFDPIMLTRFEDFLSNVPVIGADAIEKGSRNDTLFRIAAAYRGQGDDLDAISAKLTYINETRCTPPSPASEITSIAERVVEQYDPNPCIVLDGTPAPALVEYNENLPAVIEPAIVDLDEALEPKASEVVKAARQISTATAARKLLAERDADALPPLSFLNYAGLRHLDPPTWAIEGVVPATGVGQVFGESYTGKSFVALDMALRVANGQREWFGKRIARPGPVFYCLLEGLSDWLGRVDAWLAGHPGTDADRFYTLPEQPVDLADEHSIEKVAGAIEAITGATGESAALLVFDTQSLATPGTDENSNTEMNLVMGNLKRLSQRLGCPVQLVHHTGYDQTHARGATAVHAACDFQVHVRENKLKVTKVKAGKLTEWLAFDLVEAGSSVYALQRQGELDSDGNYQVAISDAQRIFDLLEEHEDELLTFSEVRQAIGDTRGIRKAWNELVLAGDIVKKTFEREEGGRIRKREGWKLWGVTLDGPIEWVELAQPKELGSSR